MIKKIKILLTLIFFTFLMSGCSTFFDKDNTPTPTALTSFKPEIRPTLLWSQAIGNNSNGEQLKMTPVLTQHAIVTANSNGMVASFNKTNGRRNWWNNTNLYFTTGPSGDDEVIVLGSRKGYVVALQSSTGQERWRTQVSGEILATPAVQNGIVIIKSVDGFVHALSVKDGHELWVFQQMEPTMILRAASAPVIHNRNVIVGFANGNLNRLELSDGQLVWTQTVAIPEGAFTIQRMTDIDATPIIFNHHIFAATYRGKIASLDWSTGQINWSHELSSYTGMVAADQSVYITDANGFLWKFNANNGDIYWKQTKLESRVLTAPAHIANYIVVGDKEGYVHWLSKNDGHFAARLKLEAPIYATPLTENNVLYVLSSAGELCAYKL